MSATGNQQAELLQADLSSQDSIRRLAQDFIATHHRLDVLVNNAGLSMPTRHEGIATRSSPLSYDEGAAKRLWQVSAELTHLDAEEPAGRA